MIARLLITRVKVKKFITVQAMVVVLLLGLLLFGKTFTKMPVFPGIYLYDFLLIIVCVISFLRLNKKLQLPIVLVPISVSVAYLAFSIIKFYNTEYFGFVFRHYALFVYLIIAYILSNQYFRSKERVISSIKFIFFFSKLSVIVQSLFLIVAITTGYTNNDAIQGHRYISPIAILGVITFGAYVIVYCKNTPLKVLLLIITFLLIFSFGHASAFLSLFMMLLFDFTIKITLKKRVIGVIIALLCIFLLFAFPQFRDVNASWRLAFWYHMINNIFIENYGILGNGFGEAYSTVDFAHKVYLEYGSQVLENSFNPYSRWLVGPHNSFLSIMFHIGFIPFLFLFSPVSRIISLYFSEIVITKELKFLIMSFIGLSIWVSFNVILELPHSSIYYWLLFFALSYFFKYNYSLSK